MRFLLIFLFSLIASAQQTDMVDFLRIEATIGVDPYEKKIEGDFIGTLKVLNPTDSVYLDAIDMVLVESNSRGFNISSDRSKIWLTGSFSPNSEYRVAFSYEAFPKQTVYFTGDQVWTQGQGKYTSHWLPSIDDMNDKIEFDIEFTAAPGLSVIGNGKLTSVEKKVDLNHWSFDMEQPMSSYLVAFAVGPYVCTDLTSTNGIPIQLYYKAEDSLKAEPTYRYTKEMFDYLETEIGIPYPWQNYKQVPVRDFLYAGMENTTATIFSEAFVVDAVGFNDRNYVNVNAHELAHQWFGNLVTETSGEHHWLHEGFASYYALLAEKQVFGDAYYYWKLYQSAEQLKELSDQGKGESLLNPKASSLTFYEKGAWALHILRENIGDENFRTSVKNYLKKHAYANVTTEDFLNEVRAVSGKAVAEWEKDWLKQSAFKAEESFNSLMRSQFMNDYFEIAALRGNPLSSKKNALLRAISFPNDFIGQEAVYQLAGEPLEQSLDLYKRAFESNNLFMRQAIALSMEDIPQVLIPMYESLLMDDSYVTREAALYNLWVNVPSNRAAYLNIVQNDIGFQDKGLRQLWLVLALYTEGYKDELKPRFLKELKNYSSSDYSFEIRLKSFEFIDQLDLFSLEEIRNLINACTHHNWRFRNAARALLDKLFENPQKKEIILGMDALLNKKERSYLASKLK